MNRLEQLGFECAAAGWLELDRGAGHLLRELTTAAPNVVPWDRLARTYSQSAMTGREATRNGLGVRVWRLREALADLGYPDVIKTVRGEGLKMTAEAAQRVAASVIEFAA